MNERATLGVAAWCVVVLAGAAWGAEGAATTRPAAPAGDVAALEKRFEETMSGVTMVGQFTMDGKDGAPKEDRYTISKVSKMAGDVWLFQARVQYGGKDVTVPIPVPVRWAGDTPVISVTEMAIPGLGTYSARVVIYEGRYAGTWSGGDHGGTMFGRLERGAGAQTRPAVR